MTVIEGRNHLLFVLRISAVHLGEYSAHSGHVKLVVCIHEFVLIEDTLGPTEASHHLVHSEILHGFLLGGG